MQATKTSIATQQAELQIDTEKGLEKGLDPQEPNGCSTAAVPNHPGKTNPRTQPTTQQPRLQLRHEKLPQSSTTTCCSAALHHNATAVLQPWPEAIATPPSRYLRCPSSQSAFHVFQGNTFGLLHELQHEEEGHEGKEGEQSIDQSDIECQQHRETHRNDEVRRVLHRGTY